MNRPIKSLNLCESPAIAKSNCRYVKDLQNSNLVPEELLKQCTSVHPTKTAFEILRECEEQKRISTTIEALDKVLNGGLKLQQITEIAGDSGSGKTQLCFHIVCKHLINNKTDEVFYVSTNYNYAPQRITGILKNMGQTDHEISAILRRLNVFQAENLTELQAFALKTEDFLKLHKIKVIIIDSIFLPFKDIDSIERTQVIFRLFAGLQNLSVLHKFAIIVTNNLTTRVLSKGNVFHPTCLGENYSHRLNNCLMLSKECNNFKISVEKSVECAQVSFQFSFS